MEARRIREPWGVPKGIKHFSALRMVAEALDRATQEEVVEAFRKELKKSGRLLACLEFAAKLNKELGAGSVGIEPDGQEGPIRIRLTWGDGV